MRKTFGIYALLTLISLIALAFLAPAAMAHAPGGHSAGGAMLLAGTVSIFDTRTMLQAILQLKRPRTFLLDTFFKGFAQFNTKYVDIDILSRSRKMAPFVSPVLEGKVMDRKGKTTNSYAPPYLKPKRPTTAGDLLVAQPGEAIYSPGVTMEMRASELLMQDLMDLDDSITRREEWMAASALTSGSINVVGDGVNDVIDFGMQTTHKITLSGAALWSAVATCDPIGNLTNWGRQNSQDSGVVSDTCIMGSSVVNYFLAWLRSDYNKSGGELSSIKLSLGVLKPELLGEGVTFLGTLMVPGSNNIDLYSYDEWYVDDVIGSGTFGQELPMVPVDRIFIGSSRAQNRKLYGAIQDLDALQINGGSALPVTRFPKSWTEKDPSVRQVMLQSASLVAMNQPDAFTSSKVI